MDDEGHRNNPAADPHEEPISRPPMSESTPRKGEHGELSNTGPQQEESTAKELAKEFRAVEIIQIVISGALAVIGVIALCIYYGQLQQMQKATEAARTSAEAAESAAKTAKQTLDSSNVSFQKTLTEMKQQTTSQQDSAKAATDTVHLSASQFKISERPYLVKQTISLVAKPAENVVLEGTVLVQNTGKTPVLKGSVQLYMSLLENEPCCAKDWEAAAANKGNPQIEIGAGLGRIIPVKTQLPLDKFWMGEIENRKRTIYVYGAVVYWDVFGMRHTTDICAYYRPAEPPDLFLWACKKGNDIK